MSSPLLTFNQLDGHTRTTVVSSLTAMTVQMWRDSADDVDVQGSQPLIHRNLGFADDLESTEDEGVLKCKPIPKI